jgi:hypothetical protein
MMAARSTKVIAGMRVIDGADDEEPGPPPTKLFRTTTGVGRPKQVLSKVRMAEREAAEARRAKLQEDDKKMRVDVCLLDSSSEDETLMDKKGKGKAGASRRGGGKMVRGKGKGCAAAPGKKGQNMTNREFLQHVSPEKKTSPPANKTPGRKLGSSGKKKRSELQRLGIFDTEATEMRDYMIQEEPYSDEGENGEPDEFEQGEGISEDEGTEVQAQPKEAPPVGDYTFVASRKRGCQKFTG